MNSTEKKEKENINRNGDGRHYRDLVLLCKETTRQFSNQNSLLDYTIPIFSNIEKGKWKKDHPVMDLKQPKKYGLRIRLFMELIVTPMKRVGYACIYFCTNAKKFKLETGGDHPLGEYRNKEFESDDELVDFLEKWESTKDNRQRGIHLYERLFSDFHDYIPVELGSEVQVLIQIPSQQIYYELVGTFDIKQKFLLVNSFTVFSSGP
jgi:hypothetical protein